MIQYWISKCSFLKKHGGFLNNSVIRNLDRLFWARIFFPLEDISMGFYWLWTPSLCSSLDIAFRISKTHPLTFSFPFSQESQVLLLLTNPSLIHSESRKNCPKEKKKFFREKCLKMDLCPHRGRKPVGELIDAFVYSIGDKTNVYILETNIIFFPPACFRVIRFAMFTQRY